MRLLVPSLLLAALGCSQGEQSDPQTMLVKRGEVVYLNNCTACHARNPNEPGPIGPPVAGSSLELLQAKVLRNEYPAGYTPKSSTSAMIALPHLEPELLALAAYLAKAATAQ